MRIGILSDTHSKPLPEQMLKDFKKVDLIIHAGDFCSMADYEALAKIKEVSGVHGNMDDSAVRKFFPRRKILSIGGRTIGVFHGEGSPQAILKSVENEFQGESVDAVIFGHSHQPYLQQHGRTLFFNPGSPNDDVFAPYCSYGILEVSQAGLQAKHVKVRKS